MALEMDALKRDREVIVKEVLTLRRQQQAHQQETDMLHSRLNQTEQLHQQLLKALTSAVQDPAVQQALAARPSLQLTDGKPEGAQFWAATPGVGGLPQLRQPCIAFCCASFHSSSSSKKLLQSQVTIRGSRSWLSVCPI